MMLTALGYGTPRTECSARDDNSKELTLRGMDRPENVRQEPGICRRLSECIAELPGFTGLTLTVS